MVGSPAIFLPLTLLDMTANGKASRDYALPRRLAPR